MKNGKEKCFKLSFHTIPERNCWKKTLEREGFLVTKATVNEICYEPDWIEDIYNPDILEDIDCKCSGCAIYS
jgi:hypothetical protein